MPTGPDVPITVLVGPDRFDMVVQALSNAGVQVDEMDRAIGSIAGRVGIDQVVAVAGLDGVLAVEQGRTIQLPSPDSEVQ